MISTTPPLGRRERNKQQKLDRITAAASALFARHGVDDVTTQQIAEKADVGTGTLFLYAKTKGELLLLVQNTKYAEALERGVAAAAEVDAIHPAVMAVLTPVIECNRVQVDNGRTYLREMVFGSPDDAHHARALEIVAATEHEVSGILQRDDRVSADEADALARAISAIMFLTLSASANAAASVDELAAEVGRQVHAVIG